MTTWSDTPTPPADTRQQAAEVAGLAEMCGMRIPTEHPHIWQWCGLPSGHWQHSATIPTALASVPVGLPVPPEPVVHRDERGQMWVDGQMYDAEPDQTDDMRREARELLAAAAFLDAEVALLAAADVAEGSES